MTNHLPLPASRRRRRAARSPPTSAVNFSPVSVSASRVSRPRSPSSSCRKPSVAARSRSATPSRPSRSTLPSHGPSSSGSQASSPPRASTSASSATPSSNDERLDRLRTDRHQLRGSRTTSACSPPRCAAWRYHEGGHCRFTLPFLQLAEAAGSARRPCAPHGVELLGGSAHGDGRRAGLAAQGCVPHAA